MNGDAIAVLFAAGERFENEEVERALEDIGLGFGYGVGVVLLDI